MQHAGQGQGRLVDGHDLDPCIAAMRMALRRLLSRMPCVDLLRAWVRQLAAASVVLPAATGTIARSHLVAACTGWRAPVARPAPAQRTLTDRVIGMAVAATEKAPDPVGPAAPRAVQSLAPAVPPITPPAAPLPTVGAP
jgi:hypothetical protein